MELLWEGYLPSTQIYARGRRPSRTRIKWSRRGGAPPSLVSVRKDGMIRAFHALNSLCWDFTTDPWFWRGAILPFMVSEGIFHAFIYIYGRGGALLRPQLNWR